MLTRMQQRRGTASQWATANPILVEGELGFEKDTNKFKIGDGVSEWTDLEYIVDISIIVDLIDAAISDLTAAEQLLLDEKASLVETRNFVAATGAAETVVDVDVATINHFVLSANCVLTFPSPEVGMSFLLDLEQDATGSRTVTWPATVKWPGGAVPALSTGVGKEDIFSFTSVDGVWWLGFVAGLNY